LYLHDANTSFFSHSEGRLSTTTPTTAPSSPSLTSFPSFAPVNVRKSKRNKKRKCNRKYKQGRGSSRGNYNDGEISSGNYANDDDDDDDDANSKSLAAVKDDIVVKANDIVKEDTAGGVDDDDDNDTCDDHNIDSQLITVVFRQDVSSQSKSPTTQSSTEIMKLSTKITLQKALEMLCFRLNTTVDEIQELEIKYPLPRKLIRLSTTNITHSTSQELQRYMMILISMIIPSSLSSLSIIVCLCSSLSSSSSSSSSILSSIQINR